MKKTSFEKLISETDSFIDRLETLRKDSDKPSGSWTIAEADHFRTSAAAAQSTMDKLLQTDLYHIIGMGNMNACQLNVFIKRIKTIGSYRNLVKSRAAIKPISIPKVGSEGSYTTSLANIQLKWSNS